MGRQKKVQNYRLGDRRDSWGWGGGVLSDCHAGLRAHLMSEVIKIKNGSRPGAILPPRGLLAMSADIFDCHNLGDIR